MAHSVQRRRRKPWARVPDSTKALKPSLTDLGDLAPIAASTWSNSAESACIVDFPASLEARSEVRAAERGPRADLATLRLRWDFGFEAILIVAVGWRSVMADERNHNSLPISKRVPLLLSARSFGSP